MRNKDFPKNHIIWLSDAGLDEWTTRRSLINDRTNNSKLALKTLKKHEFFSTAWELRQYNFFLLDSFKTNFVQASFSHHFSDVQIFLLIFASCREAPMTMIKPSIFKKYLSFILLKRIKVEILIYLTLYLCYNYTNTYFKVKLPV